MAEFVTLERFGAAGKHYHIYRIKSTQLDHQPHYHNYYQLCFVAGGEITHRQGEHTVTLRPGDAFIVPPGLIHALHFSNTSSELYSLAFEETLFSPGFPQTNAYHFLESLQADPSVLQQSICLRVALDDSHYRLIHELLDSLIAQQQIPCPPSLSAAPSIVAAILCLLAQSHYLQPQNSDQLSEPADYSSILFRCMEYIDAHYKQPLTLTDLAKRFGLSRSSLCAVFPQFAGMPLHKYISQKRIMEAQMLIRAHPERTLGQIASEVGYEDTSTFYRNFLRFSGILPSKYREMFQKTAP